MMFSFKRFAALLRKEWLQIIRDPITLRFIAALPMMQLFLVGYAVNTDPKNLPAGLLSVEHSKYERTIIAALQNTGYYNITTLSSESEAERALARGELLFVITIPPGFGRSVDRGETPQILVDADASDPTAIANAIASLKSLTGVLDRDLPPVRQTETAAPPFTFVVHARYNPEQLTAINVVPGLIVVVLIFSTVFVTAISLTRERERGTMENLLAMPARPVEVMLAKVVPYIAIGYVQVMLIMAAATLIFELPVRGSVLLLLLALGLFIAGNLAFGITISTLSKNQLQAVQFAQFTLLPQIFMSGFTFPFKGMPVWAQWIGEVFPVTHAIRIVRGILLKGNGPPDIVPELWPLALFTLAAMTVATWLYRETLD
jgi:ABC transporter DrrB family efflux protein